MNDGMEDNMAIETTHAVKMKKRKNIWKNKRHGT
jgi:hypothetical protein